MVLGEGPFYLTTRLQLSFYTSFLYRFISIDGKVKNSMKVLSIKYKLWGFCINKGLRSRNGCNEKRKFLTTRERLSILDVEFLPDWYRKEGIKKFLIRRGWVRRYWCYDDITSDRSLRVLWWRKEGPTPF